MSLMLILVLWGFVFYVKNGVEFEGWSYLWGFGGLFFKYGKMKNKIIFKKYRE